MSRIDDQVIVPGLTRYDPRKECFWYTDSLVETFRRVFGGPPWNEYKKCSVCGEYWGHNQEPQLRTMNYIHCGAPVIDFWPGDMVRCDLFHEITPEASCWLMCSEVAVIGFCWGYPTSVGDLESKLGVSITQGLRAMGATPDAVAYQDELGVLSQYRGKKIAKALFTKRHEDFLSRGLTVGVVRTRLTPEPSVTYQWFTKKLGYRIIARYPGDDGRVVLANRLDEVTRRL